MTKIKGNILLVYVNDVAIGCLNNNEFSSTNEEIPAVCKDNDGAYDSLSGGNTATITFDGTFDTDATYGFDELIAIHKNKTEVAVRMGVAAAGGTYVHAARAALNTLNWSGPLNAATVFSGTFNIRGTWNYGNHT